MFLVETAAAAMSLGAAAIENKSRLAHMRQRLHEWLQQRRTTILIYGAGGVGKTTSGEFLKGDFHPDRASSQYDTSYSIEQYRVPGEIACTALVAPGQELYRDDQWPGLHNLVTAGKVGGLINVVAWGYESLGVSYKDTNLFRRNPGQTPEQFLAGYTDERRRKETAVVDALSHVLQNARHPVWMLTLVTKQDLWWDSRHEVQTYYEQGSYNAHIEDIRNLRGAQQLRHEYRSVSLVISNFVSVAGETLAKTASGYDQPLQTDNQHNLVRTLEALFQW